MTALVGAIFLSGALTGIGTGSLTSGSTTVGNALVVWGYIQSGTAGSGYTGFSLADGGNVWTTRTVFRNAGRSVFCASAPITAGGARSVVVTGSGGVGGMFGRIVGGEFSGGTATADQIGSITAIAGFPATVTAGGVDTSTTDLVLTGIAVGNAGAASNISDPPTTGFTSAAVNQNDSTDSAGELAYRINSTAVTDAAQWVNGSFGTDGSAAGIWSFQFILSAGTPIAWTTA